MLEKMDRTKIQIGDGIILCNSPCEKWFQDYKSGYSEDQTMYARYVTDKRYFEQAN